MACFNIKKKDFLEIFEFYMNFLHTSLNDTHSISFLNYNFAAFFS